MPNLGLTIALFSLFSSFTYSKVLGPRQVIDRPGALKTYQVQAPPSVPKSKFCEQTLLTHVFGGPIYDPNPFGDKLTPPTECGKPGSWASVVFSLSGTSQGTQFDRSMYMYLNGVHVWQGSTPEPTKAGITWTVTRDMTKYIPLMTMPGSNVSLSIPNYTEAKKNLTGNFEMTLSAKFYEATPDFPAPILPSQVLVLPNGPSQQIQIPKNTATAFVEVFAAATSSEEFWYSNVPDEFTAQTGQTGKGPFREVQLWIDNQLAGVAYPLPVVYTGGWILSFWKPMAAIGAFDSPSYTFDITPFVPSLTDSKAHNFSVVVEGQGGNRSAGNTWLLDGSVSLTLDPSGKQTLGNLTQHSTHSHVLTTALPSPPSKTGASPNIDFSVTASRELIIEATVIPGSGIKNDVKLNQNMDFTTTQSYTDSASHEVLTFTSKGKTVSTHNGRPALSDNFEFPLNVDSNAGDWSGSPNGRRYDGKFIHGFTRDQQTPFPGRSEKTVTTQKSEGSLFVLATGRADHGIARTSQLFEYSDSTGATYHRDVEVYNTTQIVRDVQSGSLAPGSGSGSERGAEIDSLSVSALSDSKTNQQTPLNQVLLQDIHGLPVRTNRGPSRKP